MNLLAHTLSLKFNFFSVEVSCKLSKQNSSKLIYTVVFCLSRQVNSISKSDHFYLPLAATRNKYRDSVMKMS